MKSSIKQTMTKLNLEGADAERLRSKTRTFLMDRNGHDNARVANLDVSTIKKLARSFLYHTGPECFPAVGGGYAFVWGEDNEQLVKHITIIMLLQSRSKLKRLRRTHGISGGNFDSASGSESEPEIARGRLATVDRAYKPGGTGFGVRPLRAYPTRSNMQAGAPIIESIELENSGSGETLRGSKERRMTISTAETVQSSPVSAHRSVDRAQSQQTLVRKRQDPGEETIESAETHDKHTGPRTLPQSLANLSQRRPYKRICIDLPSAPRSSRSSSVVTVLLSLQDSRNKRESLTPYPSTSPTFGDLQFNHVIDNTVNPRNTVETIVQAGITVPSARGWELTPPPSSPRDEEEAIHDESTKRTRLRHRTTIEPEDAKFLLNYDTSETFENQIDLTGPKTVMIHVGDDSFKVVERKSAMKILQKLIDFHVNSLSVYKRRTHQAPTEGQRRIYGMKAECLSKLLRDACADESIWQGGDVNDPAVSML